MPESMPGPERPPHLRAIEFVEPESVVVRFWEKYGQELKQKITHMKGRAELLDHYRQKYDGLTAQQFDAIFMEHERAFVDHVLTRVTEILNQAQALHNVDEMGIVFNIHTSMLYDIDETLGGQYLQREFGIRSSATLVFKFMQEEMTNVRLGVMTVREEKYLEHQLQDATVEGTLVEIAPYITGDVVPIYAIGDLQIRNKDKFDPSMYPGWQAEKDLRYVLMQRLQLTEVQTDQILQTELPAFIKLCERMEVLRAPQIWMQNEIEKSVWDMIEAHQTEFKGIDYEQLVQQLTAAILMHTEVLAQALDSGEDEAVDQAELVDRIASLSFENVELSLTAEQRELLMPAAIQGIQSTIAYLRDISEPNVPITESLRHLAKETIDNELINDPGRFIRRYAADGRRINAFYIVQDNVHKAAEPFSLLTSQQQQRIGVETVAIMRENKTNQYDFENEVATLLGLNFEFAGAKVAIALQRLAACKRQLDAGVASVAVAVDNAQVAERMDMLFSGRIYDDEGNPVDGYALFGLGDEYRGRLNLIHVGKGAEYSQSALNTRFAEAMAA